jgi:hypothetical protein
MVALHAIGRLERQLEFEARLLGAMDEPGRFAMGLPAEQDENADIATMTVEEERISIVCPSET